jgi:hypothetical protein
MQHTRPRVSQSRASLILGLAFLLVFIVLLSVVYQVRRHGLPNTVNRALATDGGLPGKFRHIYDEQQKLAIVTSLAAFWETSQALPEEERLYTTSDRIEFKDNGILWRVVEHRLRTPDGDSSLFRHISTMYMVPFGWVADSDSVVACETRIIKQAVVAGGDTCYGLSSVDTVWNLHLAGGALSLGGPRYQRYTGDIRQFFPVKALDVVDRVDIDECPGALSFCSFVRQRLAAALNKLEWERADEASVRGLVDTTYAVPLRRELRECCAELFGKGKQAAVMLTIAASGDVMDAEIGRSTPPNEHLHGVLLAHAKAWKFPKVKTGGQAVRLEYRLAL